MRKRLFSIFGMMLFATLLSCDHDSSEEPKLTPEPPLYTGDLLSNPTTGQPFTEGSIDAMTLASSSTDVVLIVGNRTAGKIYAIDIQDNDAENVVSNTIASINDFTTQLAQLMGVSEDLVDIRSMEVNPISKSVYLLVRTTDNSQLGLIFKVENGDEISLVNLDNVTYSAITFTDNTDGNINDMIWDYNTLYLGFGGWGLDAELARIGAPFEHDTDATEKQTTSIYSWGGYSTAAPLEKFAIGIVNNTKRLMGLTVCAPGYSAATDLITGTGVLQVEMYFDLFMVTPKKLMTMSSGNKTYLFVLDERADFRPDMGFLLRVGQKYLDGSQPKNADATKLRVWGTDSPVPAEGMTDEDVKIYAGTGGTYMIAKYSATQLLIVDGEGKLRLMTL